MTCQESTLALHTQMAMRDTIMAGLERSKFVHMLEPIELEITLSKAEIWASWYVSILKQRNKDGTWKLRCKDKHALTNNWVY